MCWSEVALGDIYVRSRYPTFIHQCSPVTVPAITNSDHILIVLNMSESTTRIPVYGPRPYHLSETDQRGCVLIISILCIIYTFLILMIRLLSRHRNIGLDDWLSVAATVCSDILISDELTKLSHPTGLCDTAVWSCRCRHSQWELRLVLRPFVVK